MSETCIIQAGFTKEEIKELFGEKNFDEINLDDVAYAIQSLTDETNQFRIQGVTQLGLLDYLENYGKNSNINWDAKQRFGSGSKEEAALTSLVANDLNEISGTISAEKRIQVIRQQTYAQLGEMMDFMAPSKRSLLRAVITKKAVSPEQSRMMANVVDEIMGRNTGNAEARSFAQNLSASLDSLHNRYAALKGKDAKLDDWGLPQRHDPLKVRKISEDEWLDFTWKVLDIEKMMKNNPDIKTQADLMDILRGTYQSIRSNGVSKIKADPLQKMSLQKRNGIENLHKDHRFLQFKDGENWRAYQDEFGTGSVYQTVTDHIMSLSREIGLMEKFGPDYDAGFAYAKAQTMRKANEAGKDASQIGKKAETYFSQVKGLLGFEPHPIARGLQVARNLAISAKLGMATLSAQTDHAFSVNRAKLNNMSSIRMLNTYGKQMASPEFRKFAHRMAFTSEMAVDRVTTSFQHMDAMNNGSTKAIADLSMRASGLTLHTENARASFNLEFNQSIADLALTKHWDQLPDGMKHALTKHGISEGDWAIIKKSPMIEKDGAKYLDMAKMEQATQDKLIGAMLTEMDYAVPTPGARERSVVAFGTDAGTIAGEIARTSNQFMSFPVTTMIQNFGRVLYADMDNMNKMQYMAATAIMSTVLGAMVIQAKHAVVGKTPEDTDTAEFWMRAMAQGGAFGIIGDFILNSEGFHQGMGTGPVFDGPVKDLAYTLALGNASKILSGEETTFGKDALNFISKNFPGNNIWYTRLAVDRALWDQMRKLSDPNWRQTQRQRLNKMRDKGQEHWWKPGELTPE